MWWRCNPSRNLLAKGRILHYSWGSGGWGGGGGGGVERKRRSEIINTEDSEISWQHAFFFKSGWVSKTGCGFLNFSLFSWRGVTITELAYVELEVMFIHTFYVILSTLTVDSINVICNVNSFKPLSMTLSWPYFKVMWAWSWSRRQYFLISSSLIIQILTLYDSHHAFPPSFLFLFSFLLLFCCYFCIISRRIMCMFFVFLFVLSFCLHPPPPPPHPCMIHGFHKHFKRVCTKTWLRKILCCTGGKACIGIIHTVTHACVHMYTHQCMSMHTSSHTQTNKHTHTLDGWSCCCCSMVKY